MPSYTVAFFGATGGCANACLAHLLLSNDRNMQYKAVALARTPSKLIDSLKKQPGITDIILDQKLSIVQGDATNTADVKKTVLHQTQTDSSLPKLVDAVVSGIGGYPVRQKGSLLTFAMDNPRITEQFSNALITALQEIYAERKDINTRPVVLAISTTGLDAPHGGKQDVPFGLRTFYYYVLKEPHRDKHMMEQLLTDASKNQVLFQGLVIARPTLLTSSGIIQPGAKKTVKAGTELEPVTGYLIAREDVGRWIWENILSSSDRGKKWYGRKVSLAY